MQLGMIGLGRMGSSMVRRLLRGGHECVVYDIRAEARQALATDGAVAADSVAALARHLAAPRAVWLMLPAALVDRVVEELAHALREGDIIVDGGNSHYPDAMRRARLLAERGIRFLDVGTSGGVHGLERGYCLMIGGDAAAVRQLDPVFAALAPGVAAAPRTPGREGPPAPAECGYLHCGPPGAGHFVKMVHNGIEYGAMAAYAEGLNILRHAGRGLEPTARDAETTPLAHPERYLYTLDLPAIAEVWRRGSVIASWLLDLSAAALHEAPDLAPYSDAVSDSGEGRWTIAAAVDEGVPAPVLSAALYARFSSRGESAFGDRLLSAMRHQFGGHAAPGGGADA